MCMHMWVLSFLGGFDTDTIEPSKCSIKLKPMYVLRNSEPTYNQQKPLGMGQHWCLGIDAQKIHIGTFMSSAMPLARSAVLI